MKTRAALLALVQERGLALLQAIKSGGTLRKVVREQKPRPARRGLFGGEVDKILALRARVGAETDSSSGSEWDAGSDSG